MTSHNLDASFRATPPPSAGDVQLSVVIPVYNEAEGLPLLWEELSKALALVAEPWEVVFVDDGSRDGSWAVIERLHQRDGRVKGLRFSRNFGQQIALTAGMDAAAGAAVLMMDADLQHPPALIPELLRRWREGHEVVYTVRTNTQGASAAKKLTSRAFYRLINWLGGVRIEPNTADFRLLDRKAVEALRRMPEHSRFLRGMIQWLGFRQCAIPYEAPARAAGSSKYSMRRMVLLALDAVVSFSTLPLRLAFYCGLLLAGVSGCYLIYVLYVALFTSRAVPGWASVLAVVLLLGSAQLLLLGLIGEYVARIYDETRRRPLYLVMDQAGMRGAAGAGKESVVEPPGGLGQTSGR